MYLFVFRFVVQYILYFIYYISLVWFNINNWWNKYLARCLLKVSNFKNIIVNGYEKFEEILHSDRKCIIVSNHICLYDGFVLLAALGNIGFVSEKSGMMMLSGMYQINQKLNSVFVKKGKTVEMINNHVKNRKKSENILVIYADGMAYVPPGKGIAPFKTGGFVGKFDVLPVVIKYKNYKIDPTYEWYKGEWFLHSWYKKLLDDQCEISIEIMDLQSCGNQSIEQYRDTIYNMMEDRYQKM